MPAVGSTVIAPSGGHELLGLLQSSPFHVAPAFLTIIEHIALSSLLLNWPNQRIIFLTTSLPHWFILPTLALKTFGFTTSSQHFLQAHPLNARSSVPSLLLSPPLSSWLLPLALSTTMALTRECLCGWFLELVTMACGQNYTIQQAMSQVDLCLRKLTFATMLQVQAWRQKEYSWTISVTQVNID